MAGHRKPSTWRVLGSLTVCVLILVGANAWLLMHRDEGWSDRPASYEELYLHDARPSVEGVRRDAGGVTVELSAPVRLHGDARARLEAGGRRIHVPAGEPVELRLTPEAGGRELTLRVSPSGAEPSVVSRELWLGEFDQQPIEAQTYSPDTYAPTELEGARTHLAAVALDGDPADRWRAVFRFVHDGLTPHTGVPNPSLRRRSPLEQWDLVTSGQEQAYCAQFAQTFALFATAAGLKVRIVDVFRKRDGVTLAAHAFNEVYLPSQGGWVYTDATLGILGVRVRSGGRFLNAIELTRLHEIGALDGLVQERPGEGGFVEIPYLAQSELSRHFLNPNATFIYHRHYRRPSSWTAFVHRYLAPEPTYTLHPSGHRYAWQRSALWALAIVGLAWLWALVGGVRRWRRRRSTEPTTSGATFE